MRHRYPAACPSTHPCYAAAAASKPLYLIIASRTFLVGLSASKMTSHSCRSTAVEGRAEWRGQQGKSSRPLGARVRGTEPGRRHRREARGVLLPLLPGAGAGQLLLQDGRACAAKREAFHSPWVRYRVLHAPPPTPSPVVTEPTGSGLIGEGWEGGGRLPSSPALRPFVIPFFPVFSDRSTAVSHYTPRLHPDSNHTILGYRV